MDVCALSLATTLPLSRRWAIRHLQAQRILEDVEVELAFVALVEEVAKTNTSLEPRALVNELTTRERCVDPVSLLLLFGKGRDTS